jgi:hypothetical protein
LGFLVFWFLVSFYDRFFDFCLFLEGYFFCMYKRSSPLTGAPRPHPHTSIGRPIRSAAKLVPSTIVGRGRNQQ